MNNDVFPFCHEDIVSEPNAGTATMAANHRRLANNKKAFIIFDVAADKLVDPCKLRVNQHMTLIILDP